MERHDGEEVVVVHHCIYDPLLTFQKWYVAEEKGILSFATMKKEREIHKPYKL